MKRTYLPRYYKLSFWLFFYRCRNGTGSQPKNTSYWLLKREAAMRKIKCKIIYSTALELDLMLRIFG